MKCSICEHKTTCFHTDEDRWWHLFRLGEPGICEGCDRYSKRLFYAPMGAGERVYYGFMCPDCINVMCDDDPDFLYFKPNDPNNMLTKMIRKLQRRIERRLILQEQ